MSADCGVLAVFYFNRGSLIFAGMTLVHRKTMDASFGYGHSRFFYCPNAIRL